MTSDLSEDWLTSFVHAAGLVPQGEVFSAVALTGGVSSDIWKVQFHKQTFVVKRALPQLRVAQVWEAPVSRNANEVDWMKQAARAVPDAVPEILAEDSAKGIFAMSYLPADDYPLWKGQLANGQADPRFGEKVGRALASIHSSTAGSAEVAGRFDDDDMFIALRLEPYLEATGRAHPDLAALLSKTFAAVISNKRALVHGDVSPKNILDGPKGPIFLDAECAWYGDPAFDLAFCLNHMLLKCLMVPTASPGFLSVFAALADSYLEQVDWEPPIELEARAATLLPTLLLARIDGKSPVEYVTDIDDKAFVRNIAVPLIVDPPTQLSQILNTWKRNLKID